ncbi:lanthionine synthetase C family protein [Actinomadura fibrosa]|uniref:lanthionine synthetase C family protein n=1 Tax=Actinomadura fibrosa TaxID=111802 RepID=UPI0010419568|nr:lanthionine synthetase C family protein [Actinomadura fibrosa]
MLDRLDGAVAGQARQRAATLRARLDAGEPIGEWSGYDVVTGATGVGRHLLARRDRAGGKAAEEVGAALRDMLDLLVRLALTGDATAGDRRVPAWWVRHDPAAEHAGTAGHLNLGLAHGVPGPLALLALAWRAGVRVDRHAEAAAAMAALLTDLRREDAAGPYWPNWTGSGADERLRRVRDVWCYGAAGLGRALYLAGTAFGEKDWTDTAEAAVRGAFATAGEHSVRDYALCHGWAGLLQIACRMAHDTGDPAYAVAADGFADRIRAGHDPGLPFGYRYAHAAAARDTDRPGLLEGAAGIALALHCHATGAPPATGWDAALLLD